LSGIVTKFVAECGYMIVKLIKTGLDVTVDAAYVREPDDTLMLDIAYQLYCQFEQYPDALRVCHFANGQYTGIERAGALWIWKLIAGVLQVLTSFNGVCFVSC